MASLSNQMQNFDPYWNEPLIVKKPLGSAPVASFTAEEMFVFNNTHWRGSIK